MADRGAMPSRPNAIQTPKERRAGKNISRFLAKKNWKSIDSSNPQGTTAWAALENSNDDWKAVTP